MVRGVPRRSHRRPRGSRAGGWRAAFPGHPGDQVPVEQGKTGAGETVSERAVVLHTQVQGLMAVFDRPYCDVFCYTVGEGSTIYRVQRDPEYWSSMYAALSDFWWQHVVPGKHALAAGGDWEKYRPEGDVRQH